jgi:hypothetical protein
MELLAVHLDDHPIAEQEVNATNPADRDLPSRAAMPHPNPEQGLGAGFADVVERQHRGRCCGSAVTDVSLLWTTAAPKSRLGGPWQLDM